MPKISRLAPDIRVVLVTCPNEAKALELAKLVVGANLAACANMIPGLRSIYIWQGKVQDDSEVLLIIKSHREKLAELEQAVIKNHPYDTPEFVALAPTDVGSKYLEWLCASIEK